MIGDLTPKQAKFVEVYLSNGRNGAAAYRRAYNTTMSPQRCAEEARKLITNPKISPRIGLAERRAEQAIERAIERYAVSRERNVAELARIAYANLKHYTRLVESERVIDLSEATDDQLAALQEITVDDYLVGRGKDARQVRRTKIKLADKGMAIERLNKMFGWNIGRSEVGRPGEFANLTDEQLDDAIMQHLIERGMSERQVRALLKAGRGADGGCARGGTQRGRVTRL
jgi:phage terminase small subunit